MDRVRKLVLVAFLGLAPLAVPAIARAEGEGEEPRAETGLNEEFRRDPAAFPDPTRRSAFEVPLQEKEGRSEWIFAPVPNYSPTQKWGLALAVARIIEPNAGEKPSMLGLAVFGTEKKSYGAMGGYLGRLNADRLRVGVFGGYAKINSDFYGIGKEQSGQDFSVLLEQKAKFAYLQVLPKLGPIYAGATMTYVDLDNRFDLAGLPPGIQAGDRLRESSWVPGLKAQADFRDDTFYPTSGSLSDLSIQFHDKGFSGPHTFQTYRGDANFYFRLGDGNVLAARLFVEANQGDVPFYSLAQFGMMNDLRGYKPGKYRDKDMWATQAEYRLRFADRWAAVAFGGVGDVLPSFSDLSLADLLTAGGLGLRYRIAEKNPVDFRVDLAYGEDWNWYFSVGQAF